jgi:hypothetical protein
MIDPSTIFQNVRVTCKKCGQMNDLGSSEALYHADLSTPCAHCGFRFLEHSSRQMHKMMEMGAKDPQWREWVRTGRNDLIKQRLDELVPLPEDSLGSVVGQSRKGFMRLPDEKIKKAILHPDPEIRDRATRYFAKSYCLDRSIMPMVIKAVETYGRQDAYCLIGLSRDLRQTEDTIAWVIDELNDERCDQYENYAYNLSMVLVQADLALLLPKESSISDARHFFAGVRDDLDERLRLMSCDEATCWQVLEDFCEEGKDKRYTNEVNLGHANRIVEALARHGQVCEEKVRSLLSQKVDDYRHNPMKWLEPLAVRLAGQAHLDSMIPLIVTKLYEDGGDLLNEACSEALIRIGTPAVLDAVAEAFPRAEYHFRLYATGPLEYIHSDLAVEKCLYLLGQEKEDSIRLHLMHSVLSHFAPEGIEAARQFLLHRPLDSDGRELRNDLVETATIMGERFPEYDEWQAAGRAEREEQRRTMEKFEGNWKGQLRHALSELAGKHVADGPQAKPPATPAPRLTPLRKPEGQQTVGRNAPCPCGSGKKFKNCCLRK